MRRLSSAIAALLGSGDAPTFASLAVFSAPLLTSIVLAKGNGSPTFTRATTAVVCDWEQRCYLALSGEARFQGARRVRNALNTNSSENMATGSNWIEEHGGTGSAATCTAGFTDPLGGTTAFRVQWNRGAGSAVTDNSWWRCIVSAVVGDQLLSSIWIKSNTGANISVAFATRVSGTGNGLVVTATPTWQRVSTGVVTEAISPGNARFYIGAVGINGDAVGDVLVWHPQCELVNGQSNQNPAEYVSIGALPAPYHGANVDGVKYYAYQNGNTVASNVVTEATGAAIADATLLGYLSEQQSTNVVKQGENFSLTWTVQGTPTRVAANTRCGSVVLDLLGDDDAGVLEAYVQTPTFTGNATKAVSCYFAQGTSTSTVIRLNDSTAVADRLLAAITWSVGVPTVTMTTGTLLGVDTLGNGVFRARMLSTAVTAANSNQLYIYPATTAAFPVANTGNINVGGVQAEDNTFCTSYIPTTTVPVTRNVDVLSYQLAGNISNTAGTAFAEFAMLNPASARIIGDTVVGTPAPLYAPSGNSAAIYDGTNLVGTAGSGAVGAIHKAASYWSGVAMSVFIDGSNKASVAYDGTMNALGISIGTGGGVALNGTARNVKLWLTAATDAQVAAL